MCMSFSIVSVGIFFSALTCGLVGGAALALTLFLRRNHTTLSAAMEAYGWFWWFTALIWIFSSVRYFLVSTGISNQWIMNLDIIIQAAVFSCGPPLVAYTVYRIFDSPLIARLASFASLVFGIIAMWFVIQPDGVITRDVTAFSAEATINSVSFAIFSIQTGLILAGLLFDVITSGQRWLRNQPIQLFEPLYSLTIVLYLVIGTVDESKILTSWPLIIFRLLYAGIFLFVYLLAVQHTQAKTTYLSVTKPA